MRARIGGLMAAVAMVTSALTSAAPVAAAAPAPSGAETRGPWTFLDGERDCNNYLQLKTIGADGRTTAAQVIRKAGKGRSVEPLDVLGNHVLFEDDDCRDDGFARIRLATLGETVELATIMKIPYLGPPAQRIKAKFNATGSRIVVAIGSDSPWDAIRLQIFRTSTRKLLKTTTLRDVGSLAELSAGARGVLYLHSLREVAPAGYDNFQEIIVPIRGARVGAPLVTIPTTWMTAYYRSAISHQGSVAIVNDGDHRIRIVPRGRHGPRATSVRACGKDHVDYLAWLDAKTLLIDCDTYARYLVDLSGAKAKRTPVYDDFLIEESYTWIAGPG
jgi:hypothetical protein